MDPLNIAWCLSATSTQLKAYADFLEVQRDFVMTVHEKTMREEVLQQITQIPPELANAMMDIAAQAHGYVEMHGETYDNVAVTANGILGHTSSARQLAPLLEDALMRKAALSGSSDHFHRVTTPHPGPPAPFLARRLKEAHHIVVRVSLVDTPTLNRPPFAQHFQQGHQDVFTDTVNLLRDLTPTRRQELCPHLESICIQPVISSSGRDPNRAFRGRQTAFDPAVALDWTRLQPVLQHLINSLQSQVPGVPITRGFQLRVKAYSPQGGTSTWQFDKVEVTTQGVDEVLNLAQQNPMEVKT